MNVTNVFRNNVHKRKGLSPLRIFNIIIIQKKALEYLPQRSIPKAKAMLKNMEISNYDSILESHFVVGR